MSEVDLRERLSNLSKQQYEVLKLLCEGLDYAAIAERLYIVRGTVRAHAYKIRDTLEVANNLELLSKYAPLLTEEKPSPSRESPEAEPPQKPAAIERDEELVQEQTGAEFGPVSIPERVRSRRLPVLFIGAIAGLCLAAVVTVVVTYAVRGILSGMEQAQATEQSEVLVVEVTREVTVGATMDSSAQPASTARPAAMATVAPENTPTLLPPSPTPEPTDTPIPPSPTPAPSATPSPTLTPLPTATSTPLPPTEPPDTPPGSMLEVGDSWRQNGVRLKLKETNLSPKCVSFLFDFYNDTDHQMVVKIDPDAFSVQDNRGQRWTLTSISDWIICDTREIYIDEQSETVDPGDNYGAHWFGFLGATTDERVNEVIITVGKMSQIDNARWRVPIYN